MPVADAPTIRRATAEDADAIGRVQVETWRAAYTGLMPAEAVASFDVEERQRRMEHPCRSLAGGNDEAWTLSGTNR